MNLIKILATFVALSFFMGCSATSSSQGKDEEATPLGTSGEQSSQADSKDRSESPLLMDRYKSGDIPGLYE